MAKIGLTVEDLMELAMEAAEHGSWLTRWQRFRLLPWFHRRSQRAGAWLRRQRGVGFGEASGALELFKAVEETATSDADAMVWAQMVASHRGTPLRFHLRTWAASALEFILGQPDIGIDYRSANGDSA